MIAADLNGIQAFIAPPSPREVTKRSIELLIVVPLDKTVCRTAVFWIHEFHFALQFVEARAWVFPPFLLMNKVSSWFFVRFIKRLNFFSTGRPFFSKRTCKTLWQWNIAFSVLNTFQHKSRISFQLANNRLNGLQADSMIFRLSTIYEVGKLFFLASIVCKSQLTLRLGSFPHMNQLHGHGIVNSSDERIFLCLMKATEKA